MKTAKLVAARRKADRAGRLKNEWYKQFVEMRRQRDNAKGLIEKLGRNLAAAKDKLAKLEAAESAKPVAWAILDKWGMVDKGLVDGRYPPFPPDPVTGIQNLSPLYAHPPTTQAAVAAAIRKCAEVCDEVWRNREGNALAAKSRILAIPHDDTALREFGLKVVEATLDHIGHPVQVDGNSIVDRVMGEVK